MKAPKYAHNLLAACLGWLAVAKHDMGGELNAVANRARAMSVAEELPTVVCLCGSTRFKQEFAEANASETLKGNIVLSVGHFSRATPEQRLRGEFADITPEQKVALDVLHKRKIDLADEILVINVNGYVGESTASEIAYALAQGKGVRWHDPVQGEHYLRSLGRKDAEDSSKVVGLKLMGQTIGRFDDSGKLSVEAHIFNQEAAEQPTLEEALKVGAFVAVQPDPFTTHLGTVRSVFELSSGQKKVVIEDGEQLCVADVDIVVAVAKDGKEHEDALRAIAADPLSLLIATLEPLPRAPGALGKAVASELVRRTRAG